MAKTPVDVQYYRGYKVVLMTYDWDDMYRILKDDKELCRFSNWGDSKAWIDSQITRTEGEK